MKKREAESGAPLANVAVESTWIGEVRGKPLAVRQHNDTTG